MMMWLAVCVLQCALNDDVVGRVCFAESLNDDVAGRVCFAVCSE